MKIRYGMICKTIPEYSKRDNCLYTCSIGIAQFHNGATELIRIYPCPPVGLDKWKIYEIDVEKNKLDTRKESWKVMSHSRKDNWSFFNKDVSQVGKLSPEGVYKKLSENVSPSIDSLNQERRSIGVIKTTSKRVFIESNTNKYADQQLPLFQDVGIPVDLSEWAKYTKGHGNNLARIAFHDEDGRHNLQFNEWGIYVGMSKFDSIDLDKLYNAKHKDLILIGNLNSHRSIWIGLSVFGSIHHNQLILLS